MESFRLMDLDPPGSPDLLDRAADGDQTAFGALLQDARPRLLRMASFRLDCRLRSRLEAADVVQEVFLEAAAKAKDYFRIRSLPFFLWLRCLCSEKILELHRRHLGAQARDARREVGLLWDPTSTGDMADALASTCTGPLSAAARGELVARLRVVLDGMDPADREVLMLRHYEQLTAAEAAAELGISEDAASKRYLRALRRVRDLLGVPRNGLLEGRS
jgi:RNA polymerase sigma-70 factor (ECF subfamily)